MPRHNPNWQQHYDQGRADAIKLADEYWDNIDPEDIYELPYYDDTEITLTTQALKARKTRLEQIQGPRSAPYEMKMEAFALQEGSCFYCKQQLDVDNFHADHAIPYSRGGHTVQENIVAACIPCNIVKNTFTATEYANLLEVNGIKWRDERYANIANNPDPF